MDAPLLCKVDAVTVPVPDLDRGSSSTQVTSVIGCCGATTTSARLPWGSATATRIVLTTRQRYEPNWLVDDVDEAIAMFQTAGGRLVAPAFDIPVGRVGVVADPFDNVLVLVDLSKGRYRTANDGTVTGVVDKGR